jgi:GxxExxY protein
MIHEDTRRITLENNVDLLNKEEVFSIVGAAIEVHKELCRGFLEAVYQEALEKELGARGVPYSSQSPITIKYKGSRLAKECVADLVCHGKIIVELKALDCLSSKEDAQSLNYLKATRLRVGLLINFGGSKILEWKRFIM